MPHTFNTKQFIDDPHEEIYYLTTFIGFNEEMNKFEFVDLKNGLYKGKSLDANIEFAYDFLEY